MVPPVLNGLQPLATAADGAGGTATQTIRHSRQSLARQEYRFAAANLLREVWAGHFDLIEKAVAPDMGSATTTAPASEKIAARTPRLPHTD